MRPDPKEVGVMCVDDMLKKILDEFTVLILEEGQVPKPDRFCKGQVFTLNVPK